MSQGKIKLYKNSARNKNNSERESYVPQYQLMGIEPEEYKSATLPANTLIARSNVDNPRLKNQEIKQTKTHLNSTSPSIGLGKNTLPNVGNNMEHNWTNASSVSADDFQETDDLNEFIDNNDYVTENAFRIPGSKVQHRLNEGVPTPTHVSNKNKFNDDEDLLSIIQDLDEQSYLLIANGVSLCSGALNDIQNQASLLVFGEHELCDGNPIPVDNILIVKKISIKMGLFLE